MIEVSPMPEGSPFSPRQVRILKIVIVVMTGLLILGILALIYGMTRQASRLSTQARPTPAAAAQPYERTLDLGQASVASVSSSNEFLTLHLKSAGHDTIVIIDARDGHEVGRIQVPVR